MFDERAQDLFDRTEAQGTLAALSVGFGDNVRIKIAPATEAVGIAGRSGTVTGLTTPSVTRVSVVGEITGDCAISVMFEGSRQQVWLAPEPSRGRAALGDARLKGSRSYDPGMTARSV